jgi:uncharacterized membrane protein
MFRSLISSAKSAVSNLVVKYLARASVAVPFVIGGGFALAGLTLMLADRFGSLIAYWVMAAVLCLVGIVAAVFVSAKEHKQKAAEVEAQRSDTGATISDAATQAMAQTPIGLLGAAFTMPGGATAAISAVRMLAQHLPLVVLLVLISGLFWPSRRASGDEESDELRIAPRPNGSDPDIVSEMRH